MTRQDLIQPPAHASTHTFRTARRRPAMAWLAVAAVLLAAVFGVYPLLDRAESPVVQAVGDVLDPGTGPAGSTGVDGGHIPDGVATLDDDLPAVTKLDPALVDAVR